MRFLIKGRQQGKTTKLIITSEVTGYPIVTVDEIRKKIIKEIAKQMGCNIPDPISYEYLRRYPASLPIEKVLIDDAEEIIEKMFKQMFRPEVVAVTISDKNF